jgi:hypothetical protein
MKYPRPLLGPFARALWALLFVAGISQAGQVQPQVPLPSSQSDTSAAILPLTEPVDIEKMTEQDWFMLQLRLPKGVTYAEAKRLLPALSELKRNDQKNMFSNDWLFTATISSKIDRARIDMRLIFRGGTDSTCTLDGTQSRMDSFDAAAGKSTYGRMTECFAALFGPYKEDLTTGASGSLTRKWYSGPRVRVVAALVVDSAEEAMITW